MVGNAHPTDISEFGEFMRVLFVHQNFPAQYRHLAPALVAKADSQVVALSYNKLPPLPGIQPLYYQVPRGTSPNIHRLTLTLTRSLPATVLRIAAANA